MKKKAVILFSFLAASAGIEGCAVQADTQGVREEPVYITGSNIARKQQSGEVSVMSGDAYERARSAVTPAIPTMPGGAH